MNTSPSRVALVTGVSRRAGIGAALVHRLVADGLRVLASGWAPHDAEMPWGADADAPAFDPERVAYQAVDLVDPAAPGRLIEAAVDRFGRIDVVVANHARSSPHSLAQVTADELDRCWAVNARASVLLAQALAATRTPGPGGRLILFTSGQHRAPMSNEVPYAISKGAIHQMTASLADALAGQGITVNCVNPGPVDTGWATGALHAQIAQRFPGGRWGTPEDVAKLVAWLASEASGWITGNVIDSEGGFRRSS